MDGADEVGERVPAIAHIAMEVGRQLFLIVYHHPAAVAVSDQVTITAVLHCSVLTLDS